jgi:hypothetical protein
MGKNSYLFVFLSIFFVFYFFLFPFRVKEEYLLIPQKRIVLSKEAEVLGAAENSEIALFNGKFMGYLDKDYNITRLISSQGRSVLSDYYYISENREGILTLGAKRTDLSVVLDTDLTPLIFHDRIFLCDLYSGYLREIDSLGNTKWEFTFPSMITALDCRNDLVLVGLLNGDIALLNSSGKSLLDWSAGGSRVSIIYGVALSPEGRKIALVSGLDPQRFILLEEKENGYRPVFHENLDFSFKRKVSIDFSTPYHLILEGESRGLYYSQDTERLIPFELPGNYNESLICEEDGTIMFGTSGDRGGGLTVFSKEGDIIFQNFFKDIPLTMDWNGSQLLLAGEKDALLLERGFK